MTVADGQTVNGLAAATFVVVPGEKGSRSFIAFCARFDLLGARVVSPLFSSESLTGHSCLDGSGL